MIGWLFLATAIIFEVAGTLSLRLATHGKKRWYAVVVVGYAIAFTCLGFTLNAGVPLGVAYGIWSAVGVALTAVLSKWLFKEPLTWIMVAGILLIVAGVLLVELGSAH